MTTMHQRMTASTGLTTGCQPNSVESTMPATRMAASPPYLIGSLTKRVITASQTLSLLMSLFRTSVDKVERNLLGRNLFKQLKERISRTIRQKLRHCQSFPV